MAGLLLISNPVYADETPLDNVPEEFLMQVVHDVTVCVRGNRVAQKHIKTVVNELASLPQDAAEARKELKEGMEAIEAINDLNTADIIIGTGAINTLIQKYHHTREDINEKMKDVVSTSDEAMNDVLKDLKTVDEIENEYLPFVSVCSAIMKKQPTP